MKSVLFKYLEDALRKWQDKVAIVDNGGERKTTYLEIFDLAFRVLSYIRQNNIPSHSFITIELKESMEFIAAEIGVWLSGCTAVPIGVSFPDERKDYIRKHCDAVLNIDYDFLKLLEEVTPDTNYELPDELDDALLVYTSGSTGTPKGILHDFKSLENAVNMLRVHNPNETDRFAGGIPCYFIAHLYYYMIMFGTEVHIVPSDIIKDVELLSKYHTENEITITFVSATVFPLYRNTSKFLRCVTTGSDRIVNPIERSFEVVATYGLSETAGPIIYTEVEGVTDNAPIGLPVENIELCLFDDEMRPVPQGEEGEICLKGHFAKCYFKDEEQTKALYRGGWLHTKDLGRILPDGRLQFVNRKDWMVKVNGQRVEPGEIEAAMRKIDGIKVAVIKGFDNGQGSMYLCGYYTVNDNVEISENEIKDNLSKILPSYMIPTMFVKLDTFPLNQNGKIDRRSLQPPTNNARTCQYVAPTNEIEELLCNAMASILNVEKIGIDDNFIILGGDSIKIMKLQLICKSLKLTTKMVYDHQTPRMIASAILNNKSSVGDKQEVCENPSHRGINSKRMYVVNLLMDILPNSGCQNLKTRLMRWAGVQVGKNVEFFQGFKIQGVGEVIIGDNTFFGHQSLIIINEGSKVIIEDNSGLGTRSTIITGFHPLTPNGERIISREGTCSVVRLCKGSCVATSCLILPGVTVGEKSLVAAGSVVTRDVTPYNVVAGNPAKVKDKLI